MKPREFVTAAQDAVRGTTEVHWRTAIGRAYYPLVLELRDAFTRWGLSTPGRASIHELTSRRAFANSDGDMKQIGRWLEQLRKNRGHSDYEMQPRPAFASNAEALSSIRLTTDALVLLDAIDADVPRRRAVFAEIHKVLP